MIDLKNQPEGKQYFKAKVGHLMQQYERSQKEEVLHKQQLKQNIMMQIRSSKHRLSTTQSEKSQPENKSQTTKTANSDLLPQEILSEINLPQNKINQVQIKPSLGNEPLSVPRSRMDDIKGQEGQQRLIQQITFNMKKRNKSLEEQINYRGYLETEEKANQRLQQAEQFNKSINRIVKYANKYLPQSFIEKKGNQKIDNNHQSQDHFQIQPTNQRIKNSSFREGKSNVKQSYFPQQEQKTHGEVQEQKQPQAEIQQNIYQQDQRGVFLTMEESESMTASEMPKNYAFQVKMDKSMDPDHFQELKRQKIKQIQKKRQERIQEFRKTQSQKKIEMPRGRSSHSKKHSKLQKQEINEIEVPPKSTTIERKSNMHKPPKVEKSFEKDGYSKNQCIPIETQQSQYHIRHSNINKSSYNNYDNEMKPSSRQAPIQTEEPTHRPVSPFRTPKTVLSEHRPKSSTKISNIFSGESQYPRQKSATKMPEPKIQPKERKNEFNRQSNKKLMINAITHVCFPGDLNRKDRQRLIDVLQSSQHEFFIFLFKEYSRKIIKGIYTLDNTQTKLERIYGEKAPFEITTDRVQEFYRFDSGSREFKKVDGCRSFSLAIHAIDMR